MDPLSMQYELLYIIPATMTDEDVGQAEQNVKAVLEKYGASILETKRLGKFRFAYPIKHLRHGHYILVKLESEQKNVAKLDEALRISHDVLRHMMLRADEAGGDAFEVIQFTEVNADAIETRPRRKRPGTGEKPKSAESEDKSGVAALETKEGEKDESAATSMSDEELNKKLEAALEGDAKEA